LAKDPVCGMEVNDTKFSTTYKNKTYYFCAKTCKDKFDYTLTNLKKAGSGICYGVRIVDEKKDTE
jgi:YHS domain-containing protein